MNGRLSQLVARQLLPALEKSQGFWGTYVRGEDAVPLRAVPTEPDWANEDDNAVIEEWVEVKFIVSAAAWARTGFGLPKQADRFTVVLADGIARTYALLPPKGKQPYETSADASTYFLRMKQVKG
jgi:hypothetical protein